MPSTLRGPFGGFGSIAIGVDQVTPFQVGTLPEPSVKTHNEPTAQETEGDGPYAGKKVSGPSQVDPFQVRVFPRPSTAPQSVADGHDTEVSGPPG
jgi:hypothetical protein